MNKNINGATDKVNDSSTVSKGKAVHNFMTPRKQAIEEVPTDTDVEAQETALTTSIVSAPQIEENKAKDSNRRKRTTSVDYSELFLGRYELDSRQGLHVEKETIATIKRVVYGIGDPRLTVSGFVENVLKHHFETYKEEINRLFDEKIRKPIN